MGDAVRSVEMFDDMSERIGKQALRVDCVDEGACDWGGQIVEVEAQGGCVSQRRRQDGRGALLCIFMGGSDRRHGSLGVRKHHCCSPSRANCTRCLLDQVEGMTGVVDCVRDGIFLTVV